MSALRIVTAIVLVQLLASCGFALRGSEALPAALSQTYVETGHDGTALARELARQLEVAGGRPVNDPDAASAVLRILRNETGQRILSVTTTGGPEEYEVFHIVRFELDVDGERVFGPQDLTLTRDYTFDKNDVLGKRQEYDTLSEALRADMANLMLRRLALAPGLM